MAWEFPRKGAARCSIRATIYVYFKSTESLESVLVRTGDQFAIVQLFSYLLSPRTVCATCRRDALLAYKRFIVGI